MTTAAHTLRRTMIGLLIAGSMAARAEVTLTQDGKAVAMIVHNGYTNQAASLRIYLNKITGAEFDLVFCDLNMPNLDGIGLIRALRALPSCKFIPIVMLTTESQAEKKQEGKSAGATGWIVKPFKPEQLIAVVKKVLG